MRMKPRLSTVTYERTPVMPQEPTTVQRALCVALFAVLYAVIILPPACAGQSHGKEAALRPYHKVSGVSGTINSIGSDTLNN